ncbi:MAG: YceH family protein [Pirellula sp.]
MDQDHSAPATSEPTWKPLTAKQRRVLGTLMEKSKTTPDAYPMTFAGLTTGCNQKSNRAPISNYTSEQVETIIDELREIGAVAIIQGSGRVTKVRHYAYNWMGLDKVEAAVMTELLLRGEQTLGELRTRASRMEPIQDLDELKRIVDGLIRRNLMVELSPSGRGQVVSHNLYPEWELEAVTKSVAAGISGAGVGGSTGSQDDDAESRRSKTGSSDLASELQALREEVVLLRQRLEKLEQVFEKELGNIG